MSLVFRRTIARMALLGVVVAGAVMLSSRPVQAATCKQTCLANERECVNECRNSGCVQICEEVFQLCIQECD